jgi:REase_DpnII-MboI
MDLLIKTFGKQLQELLDYISRGWAWPSPEAGFVLHVLRKAEIGVPPSFTVGLLTTDEMRRLDQAPMLAAAGYYFSACEGDNAELHRRWADGFARLMSRNAFPVDRASFFYRPVELLGIALGATCCSEVSSQDVERLKQILKEGENKSDSKDLWAFSIGALAARSVSEEWKSPLVSQPDSWSLDEIALFKWICLADIQHADVIGVGKSEASLEENLLERVSMTAYWPIDIARAVLIYAALKRSIERRLKTEIEKNWQVGGRSKDALALLRTLCSRFHLFAVQLRRRHDNRQTITVSDEYDVQDLMHALLKFHFDDVRAEEWTPSYAGSASRTDFLLKQEQIIVEAKMTRKNLGQKEVSKQLIIDKESYRTHPDCKNLVCFVYDPEGKCDNPTALENDLSDEQGSPKVIVIVVPKGT